MGGFFQADLEVLGRAVTQLRASEDLLREAMRALSRDGARRLGPAVLDNAAEEFQKSWRLGTDRIAEGSGLTAQGLAGCVEAYMGVERDLMAALGGAEAAR